MKKILPYLLIIIIGIGAFYQILRYDFVWDDQLDDLITNPHLQEVNWKSIGDIWKLSYWDKYIPVTFTIRALLKLAGGNVFDPFIYHLFSLILHILNSLLVFVILKKLIKNEYGSLAGALLFLLHPLQVESVAWITANEVLISTFWALLSLIFFMRYREQDNKKYLVMSLAGYALSILSRPSLIGLPLIFIGIDTIYYGSKLTRSIYRQVLYFILMLPGIVIQILNQPGVGKEIYSPVFLRPFVWLDNLFFYIIKLIFPLNLRPVYGHVTEKLIHDWRFYFSVIFMIMLITLVYRIRNRKPLIVLGTLIFVLGMLPVSGLVPFIYQTWSNVADRYIYFSFLGISLIIGSSVVKLRTAGYIFAGLLLICFVIVSGYQVPLWENDTVLWKSTIDRSKNNISAYTFNNLGNAYQEEGDRDRAIESFMAAIRIDSTVSSAYNNLGLCYLDKDQFTEAERDFRKALELDPEYALASYNLGRLFKEQQKYNKSEQYLKRALKKKPDFGDAYNQLGYVYAKQKRWQESDQCFNRAKLYSPYNSGLYNNLGLAAEMKGDDAEALRNYERSIELDHSNLNAYNNRANLNYRLGNYKETVTDFDTMIKQDSLFLEAFYNRGTVLMDLGKYDLAVHDFGYVIVHDSLYTDAWLNRSISFYHLNELEAALYDAGKYMNLGGELHPGYKEALSQALKNNIQLQLKRNNGK